MKNINIEEMIKENDRELEKLEEAKEKVMDSINRRHKELDDISNLLDILIEDNGNILENIKNDLFSENKTIKESKDIFDELDELLNSL